MPVVCAVNTYLTFFDNSDSLGISCENAVSWKNNSVSIIGGSCVVLIIISNVVFYVGFLTMMKSKDQQKVIAKVSVITGSVLLLSMPGLVIFLFVPSSENSLNSFAVFPVVVKCLLNPFIYVWRFSDARFLLKMAIYFWNERVLAEIEAARRNYYSSYEISTENSRHVGLTSTLSNRGYCDDP
jgi:hypothetical protein